MTKRDQSLGKHGEQLAESVLGGLGVEQIEKIATPVILTPYYDGAYKRVVAGVFRVKWGEKVTGDRRGVLKGGRSVLIEVKTITDGNLQYSELEEHQHLGLRRHAEIGGLSLLVWVHHSGVYVMKYPIKDFVFRTALTPEWAHMVHVDTLREMGL